MTDVLTPSVRGIEMERVDGGKRSTKSRALAAAVLVGALVGGGLFAGTRGLSPAEIAQIRAEQTVGYYETRFAQTGMAVPSVRNGDAHWQSVIDYYETQWALRQK